MPSQGNYVTSLASLVTSVSTLHLARCRHHSIYHVTLGGEATEIEPKARDLDPNINTQRQLERREKNASRLPDPLFLCSTSKAPALFTRLSSTAPLLGALTELQNSRLEDRTGKRIANTPFDLSLNPSPSHFRCPSP